MPYNETMTENLESNVFKTALLFEGGSMRGAYTCAVTAYLLEQGVYFDNVYGVSSGSSNAAIVTLAGLALNVSMSKGRGPVGRPARS